MGQGASGDERGQQHQVSRARGIIDDGDDAVGGASGRAGGSRYAVGASEYRNGSRRRDRGSLGRASLRDAEERTALELGDGRGTRGRSGGYSERRLSGNRSWQRQGGSNDWNRDGPIMEDDGGMMDDAAAAASGRRRGSGRAHSRRPGREQNGRAGSHAQRGQHMDDDNSDYSDEAGCGEFSADHDGGGKHYTDEADSATLADEERRAREQWMREMTAQARLLKTDGTEGYTYGEIGTGSTERILFLWCLLKAVVYFFIFIGAALILNPDYDKRLCYVRADSTLATFCILHTVEADVLNNGFPYCLGAEDATECAQACLATGVPVGQSRQSGCTSIWDGVRTNGPPRNITCLDEPQFEQQCKDHLTCLDEYENGIRVALLIAAALMVAQFVLVGIYALSMTELAMMHSDDFGRIHRKYIKCLIVVAKFFPTILQFFYMCNVLIQIYLMYTYVVAWNNCSNAKTRDGSEYVLVPRTLAFCEASAVMLFVLLVIGTWLRVTKPMRGELYVPSMSDEITVPCNLDCSEQRQRTAHRCCPDNLAMCSQQKGCKYVGGCLDICLDRSFQCCIHPCGVGIELCFRQRHFLGP